jgi:hypothetical protein
LHGFDPVTTLRDGVRRRPKNRRRNNQAPDTLHKHVPTS